MGDLIGAERFDSVVGERHGADHRMKGTAPPAFKKCCIYVTITAVLVHRRLRTPVGMLLLGLVLGVIVPGALAQDSVDDLRSQRENIRREAADAAAQLNALSAEDLELVEALEALDAHIALQETKIAASAQSIETAEAEAAQARGLSFLLGALLLLLIIIKYRNLFISLVLNKSLYNSNCKKTRYRDN